LWALPRGAGGTLSSRMPHCEVHYNSPRPNCIRFQHAFRTDSLEYA
jgi:hypothetical protein